MGIEIKSADNILESTTIDCKDVYGSCETHITHCNDRDPQTKKYMKENCEKTCGLCKPAIEGL